MTDITMRTCRKCEVQKPATDEFFCRAKDCYGGISHCCRECTKAKLRKYYQDNHGTLRAKQADYYSENREAIQKSVAEKRQNDPVFRARTDERLRLWHAANPERSAEAQREGQRRRRRQNPEAFRLKSAAWRKANPEKVKETSRRTKRKHRSRASTAEANRNALKKSRGTFTEAEWQAKLASYGGRCHWCGKKHEGIQRDHYIPLARGGGNTIANIVPACPPCNQSRNDRLPGEWLQSDRLL